MELGGLGYLTLSSFCIFLDIIIIMGPKFTLAAKCSLDAS